MVNIANDEINLHNEMRNEQQDPDATLLAHHAGAVNRVRGEVQHGTVHRRNRDMVGYVDTNTSHVNEVFNVINRNRQGMNRIHTSGHDIQTLITLSMQNGVLGDEMSNSLKNLAQEMTSDLISQITTNRNNNRNV